MDSAQLQAFELRAEGCTAAELELDVLLREACLVAQYHPLPPFPPVVRDLSLVVARSLSWSDLASAVREAGGHNLVSIEYLDTFQGGNLADTEQSVHFGMTFRHPERTLTGEEVDRAVKEIVDEAARRFQARLRG
ncbi:MAG: hypothetical protein U0790_16685 [Isosphaeraceae bacterium]